MSAEIVLIASAAGLGAVFLVVAICNIAFYVQLKRHEHDTWLSLGSPMPLANLDTSNFAQVRRFLGEGRHKELRDSQSARLGGFVLITDRIFLGYVAVAALGVGYVIFFVRP
ncbi:MAG: hypothetical protein WDO72_01975 [Pseudomonadota bacterium]